MTCLLYTSAKIKPGDTDMTNPDPAYRQTFANRHRKGIHRQSQCNKKQLHKMHTILLTEKSFRADKRKETYPQKNTDKSRHFIQSQEVSSGVLTLSRRKAQTTALFLS